MPMRSGILVISIDFELYWGVRDVTTIPAYEKNLLGARTVVPRLLDLFAEYHVHATWATAGLLFFETKTQLLDALPAVRPRYTDERLSPYEHVNSIGEDEKSDPFHFAPSLIRRIASAPGQELASHTFSHYYCLEPGQDVEAFKADLEAAVAAAAGFGVTLKSLVLPRNQISDDYLPVLRELGFKAYRGNPTFWAYRPASRRQDRALARRATRLADSYVSLAGHIDYDLGKLSGDLPVNVPASRYLRPWSSALRPLEGMRLRRIECELEHAARNGRLYHLWWHPHDFGAHPDENIAFLRRVLEQFARLKETDGMESLSMREAAGRLTSGA